MLRDDDKANDDLLTLDYRACPALTHAPRIGGTTTEAQSTRQGRLEGVVILSEQAAKRLEENAR